ncbi:MAG: HD domain-containing protein [Oscillospiraceae bacterium]|nr:HD domain-containing protein [Oscillospiraceae bacterium]
MDLSRLEAQLAFLMEADKLKNIYRQTYTRVDDLPPMPEGSNITKPYPRKENDAEHSFSLALFTAILAEYSNEPVDVLKTMKMVLVHDIVEIDAGDTYCYDDAGNTTKADREKRAAERLFGLLPKEQEAEFHGLWEEFEERKTPEARFAAVMDRIQPLLLNLSRDGISWQEHGIHLHQVQDRNKLVAEGSQTLSDYIFALLDDANKRGILPD